MATYEHNALQQYKDQNGNMHIVYPVTKAENVDGLYESPALTGVPTAPTAASGTNTTQIATTKFVQTELSEIKKELSDGMTDVAAAITEKGVETATNATLALAAANIRKIKTGGGELHGATIAVTTAEETLVGMTVTLSKENATVQNKTFDENGTCSFTDIQVGGDYTISSGNGEINVSETISITGDNIVNKTILHLELILSLDGLVAMPLNDVATWLRTNSTGETSSKGYTTLAQVIADTTTLNNLMANKSAMQYLARSTGFADEGCASETFMIYLGKSTYLDSTVLNSDLWSSAICDSVYFESVLNAKNPTMTSDTTPYGIISASSQYSSKEGTLQAFDDLETTLYLSAKDREISEWYLRYQFVNPIKVKKIIASLSSYIDGCYYKLVAQGSNDGTNWIDVSREIIVQNSNQKYYNFEVTNNKYFKYYQLVCVDSNKPFTHDSAGTYALCVFILKYYGRS